MEAAVGGRLETVAPRPITDAGDRLRLVALLVLAVAVHGWLVSHTFVTARDSLRFARTALLLGNPSGGPAADPDAPKKNVADVLRESEDPPGFPVAVYAASLIVRAVYTPDDPSPLVSQMLLSTQVAASVAGVLLVFPSYWLGRQLYGPFAGFLSAAVFQVLPVPARVTSDGLSDGLCLLGLGTSLVLGVRAVANPSVGRFLQCGLVTGLAFLVRPEGVFGGMACGVVVAVLGLSGSRPRPATAAWLTALAVGAALTAAPYMVLIGGISNKPSVQGVQDDIFNLRKRLMSGGTVAAPGPRPALFADSYVPQTDGPKLQWLAQAVLKETTKSFHYGTAAFALIGLALIRGRLGEKPQFWVPVGFGLMSFGVLILLGWRREYLSERHTLPLLFVGCAFAGGGIEATGRFLGSLPWAVAGPLAGVWWVFAAVVLSALPATLKPLHAQRQGHILAGQYLAEHAKPEDTIVDPSEWAQFYAGRTLWSIPRDPEKPPRIWVVLEAETGDLKKDSHPDSRVPRMALATAIAFHPATEVVFQWPVGDVLKGRVFVYCRDESKVK